MQLKIKMVIFLILFMPYILFAAEVCPDIESIKSGNFNGWFPLYSPDDRPASPERIKRFEESIESFDTAEWSNDFLYGNGRCYYFSLEEVSLAKQTSEPNNSHWRMFHEVKQCNSRIIGDCAFE